MEITSSISGSVVAREGEFVTRRSARRRRSVAWLRVGVLVLCFCATALASFAAIQYLDAARRTASQKPDSTPTLAAANADPMLASLARTPPAALPEEVDEQVPPSEALPSLTAEVSTPGSADRGRISVTRNSAPAPRPMRSTSPATATVSVKSADPTMADVSRAAEVELGTRHSKDSTTQEPRKRLNGGKLIYGD